MYGFKFTQVSIQWRALLDTVIKIWDSQKAKNFM